MAIRTALIVIDMLNDFIDGALGNPAAKQLIRPIASLAERARASHEWVVVYANDAHRLNDVKLRVFQPHSLAGTTGAAGVDELRLCAGDIVVGKHFSSGFTETDLESRLRSQDVRTLVLVGQHTDCCVRRTAYNPFAGGYVLIVCPDATTVFRAGPARTRVGSPSTGPRIPEKLLRGTARQL